MKTFTNIFALKRLSVVCAASLAVTMTLTSCYGPTRDEKPRYDDEIRKHYTGVETDLEKWIDRNLASQQDFTDPKLGHTREDYLELFEDRTDPSIRRKKEVQLPNIADMLEAPQRPVLRNDKVVTISVTDSVPLKDVLVELARRADVDMEIDPSISGGIIFSAKDRPFSEVIERISNLANLVYSIDGGVLRIKRDTPVVLNYRFNLLNMVRTSSGELNTGNELGTGDSGVTNGSSSTLSIEAEEGDLWTVIEEGINNLLAGSTPRGEDENAPASSILSLNRMAGVISVLADSRQHREIKSYLDYVHMSHTAQVLIEAKVLEVSLDDEFRSGIDWSLITPSSSTLNLTPNSDDAGIASTFGGLGLGDNVTQGFRAGLNATNVFGLSGYSLNAAIDLIEGFGTSRTLSSPRLHAMNNQFAVLSFARNHVYFETTIEEEQETTDAGSGILSFTAESEIQTVPIGVVLNLMPSIDLQRNEVVMNIRPTLTRILDETPDPSVEIQLASLRANAVNPSDVPPVTSNIPVVGVRELDTVLRIKSGEVMVIGGLLSEEAVNNDRGVPGVSKVPFFGNAFKNVQKLNSIIETVIFIKATIVPGSGVTVEDRSFYNKFSRDRHPLGI